MATINTRDRTFVRLMLQKVHADVKLNFPEINLKSARYYVMKTGKATWEFHGPNSYYWHGRAICAYEARYKGWMAWMNKALEERNNPVSIDMKTLDKLNKILASIGRKRMTSFEVEELFKRCNVKRLDDGLELIKGMLGRLTGSPSNIEGLGEFCRSNGKCADEIASLEN